MLRKSSAKTTQLAWGERHAPRRAKGVCKALKATTVKNNAHSSYAATATVHALCDIDASRRKCNALASCSGQNSSRRAWSGRKQVTSCAAEQTEQGSNIAHLGSDGQAGVIDETLWQYLNKSRRDVRVFFACDVESSNAGGVRVRLPLEPSECNGQEIVLAFLPRAQMVGSRFDITPEDYVGDKVDVVVKDVWANDGTIVLSEVGALLVAYHDDVLAGEQLLATVDAVTEYGAFVAIEGDHTLSGLKGLVHVSEMSWSQVHDPRKLLQPGEEVAVIVQGIDWHNLGLQLSMRQLEDDPLSENIDTLFPTEGDDADISSDIDAEDSLPGLLSVKAQLEQVAGIERVSYGRRAVERGAVSQNLELWLAQAADEDDAFRVVARDGRLAQELRVYSETLSRDQFREVLKSIMDKY